MPIDGPKSKNSKLKSGIRYNENFAKTWESRNISADDPNSGIKKCLRRVDTYVGIANSDPTAFWFHMAAEPVKHSCGLIYLSKAPYEHNLTRQLGLEALGSAIFTNILPIERIYQNEGLIGLKREAKEHPGKITQDVIDSYTARDAFKTKLKEIATKNGLSWRDERALDLAFNNPTLLGYAKRSMRSLTYHEQKLAQPFYDATWGEPEVTLGQAMDLKRYPAMAAFSSVFSLTTINLGETKLDFSGIQLGNLNDRLHVADFVSETATNIFASPSERRSFMRHSASIHSPFLHTPHDAEQAQFMRMTDGLASAFGAPDIRHMMGQIHYPNHIYRTSEYDLQVSAFVEHNFSDTFSMKKSFKNKQNMYDIFPIDRYLLRLKREIGDAAPEISISIDSILSETDPTERFVRARVLSEKYTEHGSSPDATQIWRRVLEKYEGQESELSDYVYTECFGNTSRARRDTSQFSEDPDVQDLIRGCRIAQNFVQRRQPSVDATETAAEELQRRQLAQLDKQKRLERFQNGLQVSSFLQELGEKANCPGLVQGGAVLKLGLTSINSISELTGKDLMPEGIGEFVDKLGPVTAIAGAFLNVLSAFGAFGPSANEIIMEQLQQISKQIHDMHVEMHESFQEIFKCFGNVFIEFQRMHAFLSHLARQNEQVLEALARIETRISDQSRADEIRELRKLLLAIERNARSGALEYFSQGPLHDRLNDLLTAVEELSFSTYVNGYSYLAPAQDSSLVLLTPESTIRALKGVNPVERLAVVAAATQETVRRTPELDAESLPEMLGINPNAMLNPSLWQRTMPAIRAFVLHASPYFDLKPSVIEHSTGNTKARLEPTITFLKNIRAPIVLKAAFKRYKDALIALANAQNRIVTTYSTSQGVSSLEKSLDTLIAEQSKFPENTKAIWDPKNGKLAENAKWYNESPNFTIDLQKTFASLTYDSPEWVNVLQMCVLAEKWGVGHFDKRFAVYQLTDQYTNTSFYINIGFNINIDGSDQLYSLANAVYTGYRYGTISRDWNVAYCPQAPDNSTNPIIKAVKVNPYARHTPPPAFLGSQPRYGEPHNIVVTSPHQPFMPGRYNSRHLSADLKFTHGNLANKDTFKDALKKAYQAHRVNVANMMLDTTHPAGQELKPLFEELEAARLVLLSVLQIADIEVKEDEMASIMSNTALQNQLIAITNGDESIDLTALKQVPVDTLNSLEHRTVQQATENTYSSAPQLLAFCEDYLAILEDLPHLIQPRMQATPKAIDPRDAQIKELNSKIDELTQLVKMLALAQQGSTADEGLTSSPVMRFSSDHQSATPSSIPEASTFNGDQAPRYNRKK